MLFPFWRTAYYGSCLIRTEDTPSKRMQLPSHSSQGHCEGKRAERTMYATLSSFAGSLGWKCTRDISKLHYLLCCSLPLVLSLSLLQPSLESMPLVINSTLKWAGSMPREGVFQCTTENKWSWIPWHNVISCITEVSSVEEVRLYQQAYLHPCFTEPLVPVWQDLVLLP